MGAHRFGEEQSSKLHRLAGISWYSSRLLQVGDSGTQLDDQRSAMCVLWPPSHRGPASSKAAQPACRTRT
eukprot:2031546-Rhodomonas_salina.1